MTDIDIQDMYDRLMKVNARHGETAQRLRERVGDDLTAKGAEDRLQGISESEGWGVTFDDIRSQLDDADRQHEHAIDTARAAITAPTGDTNEQLLAETRALRVWPRVKEELDRAEGAALLDAASAAMNGAESSVRPVLAQELQPYLAARKVPQSAVDAGLLRQVSPELDRALTARSTHGKQAQVIRHNLGLVE